MAKKSDDKKPGKNPQPTPPPANDGFDFIDDVEVVDFDAIVPLEDEPVDSPLPKIDDGDPIEIVDFLDDDSVLADDLVVTEPLDASKISGVFSAAHRRESESGVIADSRIIEADFLSDSVPVEPFSGVAHAKADFHSDPSAAVLAASEVVHAELISDTVELDALPDFVAAKGDSDIHAAPSSPKIGPSSDPSAAVLASSEIVHAELVSDSIEFDPLPDFVAAKGDSDIHAAPSSPKVVPLSDPSAAVLAGSEIVHAELVSDSIEFDPLPDFVAAKGDSDIHALPGRPKGAPLSDPSAAVLAGSSIVRGEPISDSVLLDPLSDSFAAKADSDIHAHPSKSAHLVDELDLIESADIVEEGPTLGTMEFMPDAKGPPSSGVLDIAADDIIEEAVLDADFVEEVPGVALPESDVVEEVQPFMEDAVGVDEPIKIADSSVSLKSFRGGHKAPEKEVVLDLDESLPVSVLTPVKIAVDSNRTVAFQALSDDDGSDEEVEIVDLIDDAPAESSSVDFGQKPKRGASDSGSAIDLVAESIESDVHLDKAAAPIIEEFDDLIVEADDAEVDLGGHFDTVKPTKASAKIPSPKVEPLASAEFDDMVIEEVEEVDFDSVKPAGQTPPPIAPPVMDMPNDDLIVEVDDFHPVASTKATHLAAPIMDDDLIAEVEDFDEPGGFATIKPGKPVDLPKAKAHAPTLAEVEIDDLLAEDDLVVAEPDSTMDSDEVVAAEGSGVKATAIDDDIANLMMEDDAPLAKSVTAHDDLLHEEAPIDAVDDNMADPDAEIDEFEEPPVTTSRKPKATAVAAREAAPKARGGWGGLVGGTALGVLLTAGAGAGLYFGAPSLLSDPKTTELAKSAESTKANLDKLATDHEGLKTEKSKLEEQLKSVDAVKEDLKKAVADKEASEKLAANIAKTLVDGMLLKDEKDLDPAAFQKIFKDLDDSKVALAQVKKLLEDAKIDGAPKEGIEKLVAAKKDADDKIAEVNKVLEEEKIKEPGAKGLKEVLAARDAIAKERDEIDQTVKSAFQELVDGKLAEGDPRKNLVAGLKNARSRAESPLGAPLSALAGSFGKLGTGLGGMLKTGFDDAALVSEVNFLRLRDGFIPTTEQQIDRLAAALNNRDEKNPQILADAVKLGGFAGSPEAKSNDRLKGKALHLLGLAERNERKFDLAKKSLESATALAGDSKESWATSARQVLAELIDPSAYSLPRARKLRADDNLAAAHAELDAAIAANPGNTTLLAERGLVALDKAAGRFDAKTQQAIRADATAALNDAKSAGVAGFVLGRLEETTGNVAKAEEHYRQALKAATDDEIKGRLRLALGRLLLRDRAGGGAAPVVDAPKAEAAVGEVSLVHPLSNLVALLAIQQVPAGVDEEDDPAVLLRIKESLEIADELLKSTDKKVKAQGHFLRGDALSRKGQRTEGLKEYARGVELMNPEARLGKLLDEHPAFQTSEGLQRANPIVAEKLYGIGLHLYQERKYAEAEAQFQQAIRSFDRDARYYYFLGLSQLEQAGSRKEKEAARSLDQAGRLEANARPSTAEVNAALERIQGDRRAVINGYRKKSLLRE